MQTCSRADHTGLLDASIQTAASRLLGWGFPPLLQISFSASSRYSNRTAITQSTRELVASSPTRRPPAAAAAAAAASCCCWRARTEPSEDRGSAVGKRAFARLHPPATTRTTAPPSFSDTGGTDRFLHTVINARNAGATSSTGYSSGWREGLASLNITT